MYVHLSYIFYTVIFNSVNLLTSFLPALNKLSTFLLYPIWAHCQLSLFWPVGSYSTSQHPSLTNYPTSPFLFSLISQFLPQSVSPPSSLPPTSLLIVSRHYFRHSSHTFSLFSLFWFFLLHLYSFPPALTGCTRERSRPSSRSRWGGFLSPSTTWWELTTPPLCCSG